MVSLIRSPTGSTMRHHGVTAVVSILDAICLIFVVLVELNEGILLVGRVGHGRNWVGVGDIMAAKVITTVHGIEIVPLNMCTLTILILRLPDWALSVSIVIRIN